MPPLPSPVRAALGLAATVLDEARRLPDRAIDVPMRAVSLALQLSLRAQQRYAAFAARGDEVLSGRQTGDEAPPWATFDAPVEVPEIGADPADAADATGDDTPVTPGPRPRATKRTTKTVRAPRTKRPSAFDAVADPDDTVVPFDAAAPETADAGTAADDAVSVRDDDPDTRPGSSDDAE